jgi:hypothetical protein
MSTRRKAADLIGLLVRADRTRPELIELTGLKEESVTLWLQALLDEGLIEVAGRRTSQSTAARRAYTSRVYRWAR